ncbi:MAG: type II toxin-antitoxin system VapC family toxin [Myxococcales bacterium]|nr:type II toxin-antitoxin system VapC family toxin [Myxococcales bacterium]
MRVLLDTHALIWALADDEELSPAARELIINGETEVLVSAVSAWEIAIKRALGKLEAPDDLATVVTDAGFLPRSIDLADAERVGTLPNHHRDPFDRMLVAQALNEGVPIVTRDPLIARYQVQVIW